MPANLLARAAGKLSFAHLAGLSAKKSAEDEEDKKVNKAKKAEDDEEEKKDQDPNENGASAEDNSDSDDNSDNDKKDGKKSRKARADDEEDAENDDTDEDGDSEKDDDKDEMNGKSAVASARRRERARCAAIFGHPAAARNVALAASLAFKTTLTRKEVLAVLVDAPTTAAPAGADRAARNPRVSSGAPDISAAQAVQSGWDRAIAKNHGNSRPARPGK